MWSHCFVIYFNLLVSAALVGYADFSVRRLESTTVPFTNDFSSLTLAKPCLNTTVLVSSTSQELCAAYLSGSGTSTTWSMRVSFPEYIIALTTIFGSILFVIFGGVGMACLPMSLIATFLRRPKTTISRAQYIKEATYILKRGKDIKEILLGLQREERAGSKGRKWKKNVLKMQKELLYLEQDDEALTEVFPQGEKVCIHWPFGVLYTFVKFFKKSMKELVFHALWYGRQIPHGRLLSSAT
jgi:LMBR1 domain-containing protein 1